MKREQTKGALFVVNDRSVPGTTRALVTADGTVIGRLYTHGSPAWREEPEDANAASTSEHEHA